MLVLGIETSCDDTGLGLYNGDLLGHKLYSQSHTKYGGIVPEIASRDHITKLTVLLDELLRETNVDLADIDAIAYTKGPGLVGSLLVGSTFAKSLGYARDIPCLGINHMEGHLLSPLIDNELEFPFLSLLVSGGHTMLMQVNKLGEYELLGDTLDDAVGEAFDKTAKMLGFGYPGGPKIAEAAKSGIKGRFDFPRPLKNKKNLDFSFSGLKTHVLYTVNKLELTEQDKSDVASAFEEAVVDVLSYKVSRALKQTGLKTLVVAGGVSANKRLREELDKLEGVNVVFPSLEFCADNGAMIACAGFHRLKAGGECDKDLAVEVNSRLSMVSND